MPVPTDYLLARAETEAVRSIQAPDVRVAAIHQELCLLYTGRLLGEWLRRRSG